MCQSITGQAPFLEKLNTAISAGKNLKDLCFQPDSTQTGPACKRKQKKKKKKKKKAAKKEL
jgi:hypothetical protein